MLRRVHIFQSTLPSCYISQQYAISNQLLPAFSGPCQLIKALESDEQLKFPFFHFKVMRVGVNY